MCISACTAISFGLTLKNDIISPKKYHVVADYRNNQSIAKPPCMWIFSLSLSLSLSLSINRTHPMKPQFTTSHKQVHSLLKACLLALLVQSTMATKIVILSLMFFLTLATSIEALKYQFQKLKETNMMFYMQD